MVLFHPLEEQGRIHAKDVHFLKVGHIVVKEGELADRQVADCVSCILVLELSTQVINLDHDSVVLGQERQDILLAVAVQAFEARSGKATRYNTICNVRQIQIVSTCLESLLVSGHNCSDPVASAARSASL